MNTTFVNQGRFSFNRAIILAIGVCIAMLCFASTADAQIDGFTEPFLKIDLSSDESGTIAELMVEEGQLVKKGDPVARLDARVHKLQLEIADHLSKTTSQLIAAEEALNKRQAIADKLMELNSEGHASRSEIIRAAMELSIAKAKWLSAKEELIVREMERRRAEVQLDRRTIKAPFEGVIATVHSREGEFLSPLRPEVVTLVQIDRLIANFAVPSSQISGFEVGKEFNVQMGDGRTVLAKVYSVGVETDAKSGTVEVKLVIENPMFQIRSGEICTLNI